METELEQLKPIIKLLTKDSRPFITSYDLYSNILKTIPLINSITSRTSSKISAKETKQLIETSIESLIELGIIDIPRNLPSGAAYRISKKSTIDPGDAVCSLDPFAYISHISAMAYHGLTDRFPRIIYYSSPPAKMWVKFASQKMRNDLKDKLLEYVNYGFPHLKRITFDKIDGVAALRYSSLHLGAFISIQGRIMKVSTIGRTFLDMVREPRYCGGIRHVIDVYKNQASLYKDLILDEVEQHGSNIEKVRVGYLLDEVCNISDERINAWKKHVQRGGSRKLDPQAGYSPMYSKTWWLSLNHE